MDFLFPKPLPKPLPKRPTGKHIRFGINQEHYVGDLSSYNNFPSVNSSNPGLNVRSAQLPAGPNSTINYKSNYNGGRKRSRRNGRKSRRRGRRNRTKKN